MNQAFLHHTPDGFRVESVTAAAVAAALGTPCYVYSAGAIRDAYRASTPRSARAGTPSTTP